MEFFKCFRAITLLQYSCFHGNLTQTPLLQNKSLGLKMVVEPLLHCLETRGPNGLKFVISCFLAHLLLQGELLLPLGVRRLSSVVVVRRKLFIF